MGITKTTINKASEESRNAIRRASAYSLPNNPTDRGMKAEQIKKAFWEPIVGLTQSIIKEQDRIVEEIDRYLDAFLLHIGTGDVDKIEGVYIDEWQKEGESGITALANIAWRVLLDHLLQKVISAPANGKDPHGAFEAIRSNLSAHNTSEESHVFLREWLERHGTSITELVNNVSSLRGEVASNLSTVRGELASEVSAIHKDLGLGVTLSTIAQTIRAAINETFSVATQTKTQSENNRINLVNLSAQMLGIARSYTMPDFSTFDSFMNGRTAIRIEEDRNSDGALELYEIYAKDLKTGDNILIVEHGVPDVWFSSGGIGENAETYQYAGIAYSLIARDESNNVVGYFHISETDYTVIERHAASAAVSATEAKEASDASARSASEAKASENEVKELVGGFENEVKELVDGFENEVEEFVGSVENEVKELVGSIFTLQKAPPLARLNDAIMLPTPTLAML